VPKSPFDLSSPTVSDALSQFADRMMMIIGGGVFCLILAIVAMLGIG
jgi:hypothetical protein